MAARESLNTIWKFETFGFWQNYNSFHLTPLMIFQIDISQILYSLSRKMLGIQKVFVLQNSNSAPFGKKWTFLFWQIFLSNFNRGATIARFDKVTIQYGGRYFLKKNKKNAFGISFLLGWSFKNPEDNDFLLGSVPWHWGYCDFIFETPKIYIFWEIRVFPSACWPE